MKTKYKKIQRIPTQAVFDLPPDGTLLSEARLRVRIGRKKGIQCPCCGQTAEIHKRPFNRTQAKGLIYFYRAWKKGRPGDYHKLTDCVPCECMRGGDFMKMKHWGLIETLDQVREDECQRTGFWRMTPKGVKFVKNRLEIELYEYLYGMDLLKLEEPFVSIVDIIGNYFTYLELMAGVERLSHKVNRRIISP